MIYIILIVLLFIILCLISYLKIDVTKYEITNKKIDKDIKIMQLSDLHNRNINEKLIKIIEKEKPDMIIMSGDMINNYKKGSNDFINLVENLNKYKMYYTFGNHERELNRRNANNYYNRLLKTNIMILNDSSVKLSRNIKLYGIDFDLECYDKYFQEKSVTKYLNNTFKNIDEDKYNILVAHNPLWASIYAKKGFDLTISGHIHGGVIRLPILGGILSPEFKFFPEYFEGRQKVKKMDLIVSRGLGFTKYIKFRLFNHGEIVIINLMKNK